MNNATSFNFDTRYATTRRVVADNTSTVQFDSLCGGLRTMSLSKHSYPSVPLISIVIPVFNGVSSLEDTIRSVIFQRYDNIEFIIIDGGSQDGTLDILQRYSTCVDFWISEKDQGVYDAMNKGFKLAKGDWILFLGSDDILLNSIDKIVPRLTDPMTVYYGDVYMPVRHSLYGGEFSAYQLMCRNIPHQAIFYPRCVGETYAYDEQYSIVADYELNIRCFNDPNLTFSYIPVLVAVFNDERGLSAVGKDDIFEKKKKLLLRRHFDTMNYALFTIRHFFKDFERNMVRPIGRLFK